MKKIMYFVFMQIVLITGLESSQEGVFEAFGLKIKRVKHSISSKTQEGFSYFPEEFEYYIKRCFTDIDDSSCQSALEIINACEDDSYKVLSEKVARKIDLINEVKKDFVSPDTSQEEYELFLNHYALSRSLPMSEQDGSPAYVLGEGFYSLRECQIFPANKTECTKWIHCMKETLWHCQKEHATNQKICTRFARFVWDDIRNDIQQGLLKIKKFKKKLKNENLHKK